MSVQSKNENYRLGNSDSAIEVYKLRKEFGSFVSVNDISFSVRKGEIFGFLGANGAGKSTTIKMLCGILEPSAGDAIVAGYSIKTQPDQVKMNIGYMSQKFSLYNDLSIGENIEFFGGIYGLDNQELKKRKEWVLEIANLKGQEKTLTGSLPGGIKQRLAIGTAVIHKPGIVFLDEPTSGVDPISRRSFWDLINQLSAEGTTVFVTTHYLEEAEYCNNIVLIDKGGIVAGGTPKELKNDFLKNPILELECNQPIKAMQLLERADCIIDISLFGNNLHLSVSESENASQRILEILSQDATLEIIRLEKIVPTLEDVFISLLESKTQ